MGYKHQCNYDGCKTGTRYKGERCAQHRDEETKPKPTPPLQSSEWLELENEFRKQFDELKLKPPKNSMPGLERELIIDFWRKALKPHLQQAQQESYRKGYNDNARDCYCNSPPIKPHRHLMSDGKSYDIKPDISRLDSIRQQGGDDV